MTDVLRRTWGGKFWDLGGYVFNVMHPKYEIDNTGASYADSGFAALISDAGGQPIHAPPGLYRFASPLSSAVAARIRGVGLDSIFDFSDVAAGNYLIQIEGSLPGVSTTATDAIAKGATSIEVDDSYDFEVGEMIKITSTEAFSETDSSYKKGELAIIKSIPDLSHIVLRQGTKDSYSITGETVTITKVSHLVRPEVSDIKIIGGGAASEHKGLFVRYALRPLIKRVLLEDSEDVGIAYDHVMNGRIHGPSVVNTDGGGAVPGYAIALDTLCQDCHVDGPDAENFRHAFSIGSLYPCWNWKLTNFSFSRNVGDFEAISSHNNGINGVISGGTVHDGYIGIGLTGPGTTINNVRFSAIRFSCIDLSGDALLRTTLGKGITGVGVVRGITSGPYAGTTKPDVTLSGDFTGEAIAGVAVGQGVSCNTPNARINVRVRGFSPGIGIGANYVNAEDCHINDVKAGQPYGYLIHSSATGVRVRGGSVRDESGAGLLAHAFVVDAGTDVLFEDVDASGYTTSLISNSGTRTRVKNIILNGVRQRAAVLGATVGGVTNGTTAGRAKTTNSIAYEINKRRYTKAATDDLWNLSGVSTGGAEFRKVLLCLDESGAASIVTGTVAASQSAATIPDWQPFNVCPIGIVEIPNSYAGGSLSGFVFQDLLGVAA